MKKYRLSLTGSLLVFISAFLLVVNVTLGVVLTRQSIAAMRSLIESRMLDVSNTAADLKRAYYLTHADRRRYGKQ